MSCPPSTALPEALEPEAQAIFSRSAQPLTREAGAVLFRAGDACPGYLVVRTGLIRVGTTAPSGRSVVLYRVAPGGACLQTLHCLMAGAPYAAEGVVERRLEGAILPLSAFRALLAASGVFRDLVLQGCADRFHDLLAAFEATAFQPIERRLAAALLALSGEAGVVSATHEAIAAEIGSAREVVSRQLERFAEDGLVTLARGRVEIADRARMSQRANGGA